MPYLLMLQELHQLQHLLLLYLHNFDRVKPSYNENKARGLSKLMFDRIYRCYLTKIASRAPTFSLNLCYNAKNNYKMGDASRQGLNWEARAFSCRHNDIQLWNVMCQNALLDPFQRQFFIGFPLAKITCFQLKTQTSCQNCSQFSMVYS